MPRLYLKLPALKTVLVNHHTHPTPPAIGKTAHHSSPAFHLHVDGRAQHIGGKRNRKIHSRTYWYIGIHAEKNTVGGNVFRLRHLFREPNSRDPRLVGCRLQ